MPLQVHVNNKRKLEVLGGVKTRLKVKHISKTRREVHSSGTAGEKSDKTMLEVHSSASRGARY